MAPKKNALSRLLALEGAVTERRNVHETVLATASPSVNFSFGKGHGLPEAYSLLLYGPPRGGKSVLCNMFTGYLHQADPDAIVIRFNTEFRENAQLSENEARMYGIDQDRIIPYEVNQPDQIFDRIEKDIAAEIQDGLKVKLIIIDSLNAVQGRRSMNTDTVMTQQIGDNALTIQEGLKRILPIQRKYGFGLILTSHIRTVMDTKVKTPGMVFKNQTTAIRPAVSYGTQHHCEYYMYVEPAGGGAAAKADEAGNKFVDESVVDAKGEGELLGHKISVKMVDSSLGPKGRAGTFTFDYNRGVINVHEEVFHLGVNRGIVEKIGNSKYAFNGKEWYGKPAFLEALKNSPDLQSAIITELRRRDMSGLIAKTAEEVEAEKHSVL